MERENRKAEVCSLTSGETEDAGVGQDSILILSKFV